MKTKISIALITMFFYSISYGQFKHVNRYNEGNYSLREFITSAGNYNVVTAQKYDKINLTLTYLDEVERIKDLTYSSVFSLSLYYSDPKAKSEADLSREIKSRYKWKQNKVSIDTIGLLKSTWRGGPILSVLTFDKGNQTYELTDRDLKAENLSGNEIGFRRYLLKNEEVVIDTLYCSVPSSKYKPIFFTLKTKDRSDEWNKIVKIAKRPKIINSINQKYGERLLKEVFIDGDVYIYKVFFNGKPTVQNDKGVSFKIEQFIFSNISTEKMTSEILLKNVKLSNKYCKITFVSYELLKKINLIDFYPEKSQQIVELYAVDHGKFNDLSDSIDLLTSPYNALKKNPNTNVDKYTNNYFLSKIEKDTSFLITGNLFMEFTPYELIISTIEFSGGSKYSNNNYSQNSYIELSSFDSDELIYTSKLDFDKDSYDDPWKTFSESIVDIQQNVANHCVDRVYKIKSDFVSKKTDSANEQKVVKALETKYGKKYVDLALAGDIVVGMPEGLLPIPLKLWSITSRTKWKNGYRIYCTSKLDSSVKLSVYVVNGKVTLVSY